ncbi:MAG: hypothetical protein GY859_10560, partial [Desulfobacterales bacterium]|nr:hypothetical protein [Desulfobacterales bacterium]
MLKKVRRALRDGASRGEELHERLWRLDKERTTLDQALALAGAEMEFDAEAFGLKMAAPHSIELARRGKNQSLNQVIRELGELEKLRRIRFNATLGLLSFSSPGPRVDQPGRMRRDALRFIRTLRKMDRLLAPFDRLHSTRARLNALVQHHDAEEKNPKHGEWIQREIREMRENLSRIREPLGELDYPFAHGKDGMTMGDYVVEWIPSEKDEDGLLEASKRALNRFHRSRRRLIGRLACMAEIMETSLGLSPLKGASPAMGWSELAPPDNAKRSLSVESAENGADGSPENRMGALLQKTRARFGAAPRSFSPGRRIYNRIRMPSGLNDVAGGAYKVIYRDQKLLMREGRIVWGHIVQA